MLSAYPLVSNYGILTYDFTSGSSQFYGGTAACKLVDEELWGMPVGDANSDGVIDESDKTIWNSYAGSTSYHGADFNMDTQLNNKDVNDFWVENISMSCQVPE